MGMYPWLGRETVGPRIFWGLVDLPHNSADRLNAPAIHSPRHPHRLVYRVLWLGLAGVVLLVCMLLSELLLLPFWLEPLGRVLYRAAFFLILPLRVLLMPLIPRVDHHWPLQHYVAACLGTPYFLWGVAVLYRRAVSRLRAMRPRRAATVPAALTLGRREFLLASTTGAAMAASGGIGFYASLVEPSQLRIRRYEIPIAGLPAELEGLRLVHVTDTHYGPYNASRYIEEALEAANALEGDLAVLTGDYVHFTPRSVAPGIALFARLKARFGTVAVLGNHEHWESAAACREAFRRIGVPLVDNDRLFLTRNGLSPEPDGDRALCVAGLGDLWEDRVLFARAFRGVPDAMPRILLSHNPDAADLVDAGHRVDLMLSGHTHGGQVSLPVFGPPVVPSRSGAKYLGGLCEGPRCPVLVSRGVGMAGIPMRLRVPPEISEVRLVRA